jgi:bifunctional non-homologous end joining protein LigD
MTHMNFGPYRVELSNINKPLFPEADISKGELIRYYQTIAATMLPHLQDRPITLHRYPDGIDEEGFYQQEMPDYFPEWIQSRQAARADDDKQSTMQHILCNNQASLVYLANQAVITLHGWLARVPKLHTPDRLVFDLDPSGDNFSDVRQAAHWVIELMEAINLCPFVMTTGSRGLHVVSPLRPELDFDAIRNLAKDMAAYLTRKYPEYLTIEHRKHKRRGRIYLDVMRNAYGQTSVIPYSVRALPGAPIATPLELSELGDSKLHPQRWHMKNILRRLAQKDDPWRNIWRHACSPRKVQKTLNNF